LKGKKKVSLYFFFDFKQENHAARSMRILANDKKIILNSIPVGQKATIIAFSLVNNEPYFVSKDIIISKDQKENMTLIKTTMTALKNDLKKLD
jgi:hypothetical protein